MVANRTLYILDSVAAARALVARRPAVDETVLLSTHCSVIDFLAARGVSCRDFSEFTSAAEVQAQIREASSEIDAVLARLDGTLGARMCAAADMPRMALFHACSSISGNTISPGSGASREILGVKIAQGGRVRRAVSYAMDTSTDAVFSFVAAAQRVCRQRESWYAGVAGRSPRVARCDCPRVQRLCSLALRALQSAGPGARQADPWR